MLLVTCDIFFTMKLITIKIYNENKKYLDVTNWAFQYFNLLENLSYVNMY